MSKASEWVKQSEGYVLGDDTRFVLNTSGGMNLVVIGSFTKCLTADQALALRDWITEMFDEDTDAGL